MANHKAKEPRTMMKVPVSFRDIVAINARIAGMTATTYLENMTVCKRAET